MPISSALEDVEVTAILHCCIVDPYDPYGLKQKVFEVRQMFDSYRIRAV